jgi:hypothetical protein
MNRGMQNLHAVAARFALAHGLDCDISAQLEGVRVEFKEGAKLDSEAKKLLFMASTISWLEVERIMQPQMDALMRQWEATWANRDRWKDGK